MCGWVKRETGVERVKKYGEECENWMGLFQRRTSHTNPDVYVSMLCYCCWFGPLGGGGGFYVGEGETGASHLFVYVVLLMYMLAVTGYQCVCVQVVWFVVVLCSIVGGCAREASLI